MVPDTLAEVLLNWIAAASIVAYLIFVVSRPTQSSMEKRLVVVLALAAVFLTARGFRWLTDHPTAVVIANTSLSVFPLLLVIFVEHLLRRHSPLFLKTSVAVATVIFCYISLFGVFTRTATIALLVFILFVFLTIALIIFGRDKSASSEPENHLIDTIGVATMMSLPLAVTDFRTIIEMPIMRVGSIAALLFIYAFTRQSSTKWETGAYIKGLLVICLYGLVLGLVFASLSIDSDTVRNQPYAFSLALIQPYVALGIGLAFLLRVLDRLVTMRRESRSRYFQNWLATTDTSSIDAFVESVLQYAPLKDSILVSEKIFANYDFDSLRPLFNREGSLLSIDELKCIRRNEQDEQQHFAAEQLIDLLSRNQCNQFCLLDHRLPTALLVNIPLVAGAMNRKAELVMINKIARALDHD